VFSPTTTGEQISYCFHFPAVVGVFTNNSTQTGDTGIKNSSLDSWGFDPSGAET